MTTSITNDDVFRASKIALDGLSARQQAITRNVANIDTPGYRAQTITFERAVKIALDKDTNLGLKTTDNDHLNPLKQKTSLSSRYRQGGSLRADGNNVDVDVELVDLNETEMRYDTVVQMVGTRYRLLKDISQVK